MADKVSVSIKFDTKYRTTQTVKLKYQYIFILNIQRSRIDM